MGWFRKKKTPQQEIIVQPAREGFLTHSLDGRIAESRALRVDRIMEQVNAVVANNPMPTPRGCAPYAMDAANSENPSIVKAGMSGGLWNVPDVLLDWYASHAFIGPQACAFMAQQWLINKACTIPARDAVRNWFEITSAEGDEIDTAQIKRIERLNKKHLLKPALHEFVRMGRIFGVRVLLFKVDPGRMSEEEYYRNPFNLDAVKPGSYKGLVQIDPYWCGPMLDSVESAQPDDPHFYEPTWWIINGRPVHRTHLAIFRNAEVPDILKPAYLYGGVPVPQQIMERVYAAERTANEMPLLAMSKRLTVLKVDVDKFFANLDDSWNRILQWMGLRDNSGIKVCDRDSEDITQIDTTLTDLDDVVMTSYQLVAAAADVPVTKLLGTSPKGFNATGEYDEASYHETLESIQEHDLTPVVDRHHQLLCKSEGLDFDLAIEWNPLDAPTELEQAQTQKTKAETDQIYVNLGSIDQYDSRNRLIQDNRSGFTWLEAIERPEELDDLEPEPPPTGGTPQGEPSKGQEREGRQAQAMDVKDVNGQEHAPAGSSEGGQFTGEGGGGGQKGKEGKKVEAKAAPASNPVAAPDKPEWEKKEDEAQQRVRDLYEKMQAAVDKGDYAEFEKYAAERTEAQRAYKEAYAAAQGYREDQRKVDLANADVEKINASVSKYEAKNRNLKYEKMTVVDLDGNVLTSVKGDAYSVKIPKEISLKDKTVTHNHPSCTTFSPADVDTFGSEENREMRATTLDGKTYSILRTGTNLKPGFGQSAKNALDSFVTEALIIAEKEKGLTFKDREAIFEKEYNKLSYEWFKKNEEKYGYKYTVS